MYIKTIVLLLSGWSLEKERFSSGYLPCLFLYTLAKLMGHEGINVLQRYLKQIDQDTEAAHRRAGPVDNSELLGLV
jgi:hypothetical protein